MAEYRLQHEGGIIRTVDNAVIPRDPHNRDYAAYSAWVALGNKPDPAIQPVVVEPTTRFRTKFDLYDRMNDQELTNLDNFLRDTATVRQRLSWTDALEIDCMDPRIVGLAVQLFGEDRAKVILQ